jgi:pimeloyl-ACP methyl ester carboxylesterase
VLVHGICGTPESFGSLGTLLSDSGFRVEPFDYSREPSDATIRQISSKFGEFVKAIGKVDVVAHSMGGLIARAWMAGVSEPFIPYEGEIGRLILVGTPNYGAEPTAMRSFVGGLLKVFDSCAAIDDRRQLYFGSELVTTLDAAWRNLQAPGNPMHISPESMLVIAGTQNDVSPLLSGYECDEKEGCDDGVVDISSTGLPEIPEASIRYLPYRHADLDSVIPPAGGPALANVTDAGHGTFVLVQHFLTIEGPVPNLYNPPHRRGDVSKQEGLLLLHLPSLSLAQIATARVVLTDKSTGQDVSTRTYALKKNIENNSITIWGIAAGGYDLAVRAFRTIFVLDDVTVEVSKATVGVVP